MKRSRTLKRKTRKYKKKGGASSMEVRYPTFIVDNNETTQVSAKAKPVITLYQMPYSTLIMYDPDASSGTYLHYLVINIANGNINSGDTVTSYAPPTPPPGSGSHRYIFEQLQQTSPFTFAEPDRAKFNIDKFKQQNNLALKATKQFRVLA
jgi:phosphatidylethanolamine-binding protein (PEBP) family uncharacterized protein